MIIDLKTRAEIEIEKGVVPEHDLTSEKAEPLHFCDHYLMTLQTGDTIDDKKVLCRKCGKQLDPYDALRILSSHLWWAKQAEESKLQAEVKRIRKIRKAALECFIEFGVTPEQYAGMLDKVKATWADSRSSPRVIEETIEKVANRDGAA